MNSLSKRITNLSPEKRELLLRRLEEKQGNVSQTKIQAQSRESNTFPLSFAQQRLWFFKQLEPDSSAYNIPATVRLSGLLNLAALEKSIDEVVRRHEALRTTFTLVDGQPVQVIHPASRFTLPVVDLQSLNETEQNVETLRLATAEAQRCFDLEKGPLLRVILLQMRKTEYVLLFTMHHIVSDAWSTGLLIRELVLLYKAFSTGQSSPLPELPIQYADFAVWQRHWLQGEIRESQLFYWKQQLSGELPVLQLPTDYSRPITPTYRGSRQFLTLSKSLTEKLKDLSHRENVTLFMTLLAAFQTLLYRYTRQEDILVGSPIANRNRSELEGVIGFFVNTLVLRTDLSGSPSFRQLLDRVKEVTLGAYAHQDLPFEQLVQAVQPDRNLNQNPLFEVLFSLQNTAMPVWQLPNLTLTPLHINNNTAKFDLTLLMEDTEEGLVATFEYNTDLFDRDSIHRMLGHFSTLLDAIVANPDNAIANLPLLTASEKQQLIVEWNNTKKDYPLNLCIHQLFEQQVERTPDAVALVFENQQLTYRELNNRANQLTHYLQHLGVKPDILVGICIERSLEMVIGLLGILKAGGAYLPLDPAYPKERLAFMLADASVPVLLTQEKLLATLPAHQAQVVCLDTDWEIINRETALDLINHTTTENLAYVIYTSGSTGQPKGVQIPHGALVNFLNTMRHSPGLTQEDILLSVTTLSFDIAALELYLPLIVGARLVLVSREVAADGTQLLAQLTSCNATVMQATPATWRLLLAAGWNRTQQLKILCGGEALDSSLANQLLQRSTSVWNLYGPTETTIWSAVQKVEQQQLIDVVPIGRPIANTQIYLLDKHLQPVPIGVAGELHIGGVGLARGYLNRPELTNEKFIPSPFALGERLYKTGDLARYRSNGNIEFLGRIDHQVKIRGFRIELGEIEAVLEQHSLVRQAVVIAREDVPNEKRLVAYVVFDKQSKIQNLKSDDLRRFLHKQLPSYMVPSAFVLLESLPLTPNGKVDRRALPAPETKRSEIEPTFVDPRNDIEKALARIWTQILGVEKVGIHDNFFELGGHSLLTTRLLVNIREALQVDLPLRILFESPTLVSLAETIERILYAKASTTPSAATVANLNDEAVLDSTIVTQACSVEPRTKPACIFLTGATGFLGAFLLYELLQQTQANIYCLVRSTNAEEGKKRLRSCLESYLIWNECFSARIIPVIGDLSQPLLGLSEDEFQMMASTIDVIYHNGAWVHHIYPYSVLKTPNVIGTQEVLRLASKIKVKPVHFISTVSIFSASGNSEVQLIREQDSIDDAQVPNNGYVQTKWLAERLIRIAADRGVPICIYRPSRISGHSQTGVFNQNDFLYKLIIGCSQLGTAPDRDIRENIIPVDYVSKAIVHLSKQEKSLGKAFHLTNPQLLHSNMLIDQFRLLGYAIEQISYEQWRAKLLDITKGSVEHPLYPLVPFFPSSNFEEKTSNSGILQFDCQNTLDGIAGTSIVCPPVDNQLLSTYFSYLKKKGFFDV
ncbi:nonribosomal protein synthetase [Scytonema sp. HK-05]|uniref:non-ribosomal peptide synthetase family protein n=1 Tax=Scytonema sp. HK-05 TaxID=1137095 RepID=UPI000936B698|nr:non-ribosomal peptide synthetase [Scytonema sp. HK-05]OKH56153.1 non-ribosomal peptide synthetase [Scytonema sp. HK-05]BAY48981.1 nonribosomal protein synthetase [Scytonema sp. HK-05]